MCCREPPQSCFGHGATWQVAEWVQTEELGDDRACGLGLGQDPGRAVPGNVRSLLSRRVLVVGLHDVAAVAVLDVPTGIEHMPVGRPLDGGRGRQFVLGESRLEELHQSHDLIMT